MRRVCSRSTESEQRLDSHARFPGLFLLVLLQLHEFPLALAELLLGRCRGRRRRYGRSRVLLLLLEHPQGLEDVPGLVTAYSGAASVLVGVDDRQVGEARLGWGRDVGKVPEVGEEVTTSNGLGLGVLVVVGTAAPTVVVKRAKGGLIDAVLVVLLVLWVIGSTPDDPEVTRSQQRVLALVLVAGAGSRHGVRSVPGEVSQESAGSVALLGLLVRGGLEGQSVRRGAEQLGEGREEVLAVGLQALLLGGLALGLGYFGWFRGLARGHVDRRLDGSYRDYGHATRSLRLLLAMVLGCWLNGRLHFPVSGVDVRALGTVGLHVHVRVVAVVVGRLLGSTGLGGRCHGIL